MTREEALANMAKTEEQLQIAVTQYNEAVVAEDMKKANEAEKEIDRLIGEYSVDAQHAEFERCRTTEDPMQTAVKLLSYTVLAVKDVSIEGSSHKRREVVKKQKQIDLAKLHKYCGGIGANPQWINYAEKLNFLLTAKSAKDLGIDPKEVNDSYMMEDISRDLDMGKTPTSNTNLLRTLNLCVAAMIGDEHKAKSHDVAFLLKVYEKHGKTALSVACSNHAKFRGFMAEICHRILLDEHYKVEYKAKKS